MTDQSQQFNATDLLDFFWKYRKILSFLFIGAVIISSITALMIENKYSSSVTLYPTKTSAVYFNDMTLENMEASKFGNETEVEQMMQILESAPIRIKVCQKFDLMNHYKIDTSGLKKDLELYETYTSLIDFSRNGNGAVIISVLDHSRDTAALIASYISILYDTTKNNIIHERSQYEYQIKKDKLESLQNDMNNLQDSISSLTNRGAVPADAYEGLALAMVSANDQETKNIYIKKMEMTEIYGGLLNTLMKESEILSLRISKMNFLVEQAETSAFMDISHKFVIEDAVVPLKKAYPIRWLIVLIASISTLFLGVVLLLFYEKFKELRAKS